MCVTKAKILNVGWVAPSQNARAPSSLPQSLTPYVKIFNSCRSYASTCLMSGFYKGQVNIVSQPINGRELTGDIEVRLGDYFSLVILEILHDGIGMMQPCSVYPKDRNTKSRE